MKRWVKALRSGKYKQTIDGCLQDSKGYCCLGILCEVARKNRKNPIKPILVHNEIFGSGLEKQPKILRWAELKTNLGHYTEIGYENIYEEASLATLNDRGWSFKRIATFIEKNWKDL